MSGVIDPTKAAKYPVVLSEALLGGPAKNVFTNIRYNHKPELSSETAPEQARLKPATIDQTDSYELSFQDGDSKYAYAGTRTIGDNQYILYFDPSRKVFVLDKVDSTFDMNITRTPETTDPAVLRRQFEQLGTGESGSIVARGGRPAAATPTTAAAAAAKAGFRPPPKRKVAPKKKKEESGSAAANIDSSPEKQKPSEQLAREESKNATAAKKKSKRREVESEEDDDDDDDPLLVEYPGAPPTRHDDFSPAFPDNAFPLRRFSEFAEQLRESGNEFEDERDTSSEGGLNGFKLPSPVGRTGSGNQQHDEESEEDEELEMEDVRVGGDARAERDLAAELEAGLESELEAHLSAEMEDKDGDGDDLERDLAAELENELMMGNSGQDADSESEVSEED
ncbi:uncharacterized protein DNG_03023 [Cephalotrichum gorgonifer]|uniref:Transcription elongation factor Eaf N-terminal domain-containing protein n=1 Tax=Cephalotrichum gorgonifer TaxID=2041049 RepID=A0AAE8MVU2_9PEZI|nr:uncharacterized protein DNG_03023 [Cephalotrichum gorgonifer]